jgi:hypothetical protein
MAGDGLSWTGIPARQEQSAARTVNPSGKLRRFESFTRHLLAKRPLTCCNSGEELSPSVLLNLTWDRLISLVVSDTCRRLGGRIVQLEGRFDPLASRFILAVDALRVDPYEDVDAVPDPLGNLGCRDSRVQPE